MADDLGWADLSTGLTNGGHGNDYNETPRIDQLAEEGQVFTEAYASVQCSPTRTALHTGQYATRPTNNVYAVGAITGSATSPLRGVTQGRLAEDGRTAVPVNYTTLGENLQNAGYTTGYTGKFHVTGSIDEIVTSHGYDESWGGSPNSHATYYFATNDQFNDSVAPALDTFAGDYTQEYVNQFIAPYSRGVSGAQLDALVGTDKHVTDAQTDATLDFIDRSKRAVLRVGERVRPALPGQRRPGARGPAGQVPCQDPRRGPGQAVVRRPDRGCGPVGGPDHRLPRGDPDPRNGGKPLADNTLVIFTSDNGGEEDPVNSGAFNGPLRADKGQMYEGGVRVPWIVWSRNADLVRGGGRANDTIVNSTDLYTTLASYAQAQLPAGVPLDGIDLKPAFSQGTKIDRDHFHHLPGYVGVQGPASSIRDGRWNLYYLHDRYLRLFDLATDVGEPTDLAPRSRGWRTARRQLIEWLDETDAPLARCEPVAIASAGNFGGGRTRRSVRPTAETPSRSPAR